MNWLHWFSLGYWLGSNNGQQGNSKTGVGCIAVIVFVLVVEYLLPKWVTKIIVPGLLFGFKPLQIVLSLIMVGICFYVCRKINAIALRYIVFFIGVSNFFYFFLLLFDSRF
ncbi:hypothetical protein AM501_28615 [Aneurinibacillus migulanus]|nr:hypothetical protein TS64_04825 [Aneurinibacillus migulanus]KPD05011.1 hypothetical protein AM501_28615 [Aneurinibacillus migulanus]CEH28368.1 Uncharacterized protein BN1090_A2_00787 [Aneurinibacillus migulanus]